MRPTRGRQVSGRGRPEGGVRKRPSGARKGAAGDDDTRDGGRTMRPTRIWAMLPPVMKTSIWCQLARSAFWAWGFRCKVQGLVFKVWGDD